LLFVIKIYILYKLIRLLNENINDASIRIQTLLITTVL